MALRGSHTFRRASTTFWRMTTDPDGGEAPEYEFLGGCAPVRLSHGVEAEDTEHSLHNAMIIEEVGEDLHPLPGDRRRPGREPAGVRPRTAGGQAPTPRTDAVTRGCGPSRQRPCSW